MALPFAYDNPLLSYDAASVDTDELRLSGPAPAAPPSPGVDPWTAARGETIENWTNASYPGADLTQGGWSPPNESWLFDSSFDPPGWYTRKSRKDRPSS